MNKNPIIGGFEDAIERGQSTVSSTAKQAAKDFTNSATGQITGNPTPQPGGQGTNEQANAAKQQMSDDAAKQFLKDLYGPTDKSPKKDEKPVGHPVTEALGISQAEKNVSHPVAEALGITQADPNVGKTPEEVAKLQKLRSQLHQDYYQGLVNPPKPEEKPVAEKLEEEKKMEELEEAKKEQKKPGPLQNVKVGTGEKMIGVSG